MLPVEPKSGEPLYSRAKVIRKGYNMEVSSLIMILAIAVLITHLVVSAMIWRRNSVKGSLKLLLGLSVVTTLIWVIVSIPIGVYIGLNPPYSGKLEDQVFGSTFGLLIHPCDKLPQLEDFYGVDLCPVAGLFLGPLFFFSIGLLPSVLRKRS